MNVIFYVVVAWALSAAAAPLSPPTGFDVRAATEPALVARIEKDLELVRAKAPGLERTLDEAQLLFFKGFWTKEIETKVQALKEGRELAERAMKELPDSKEAMLWWAANAGDQATAERKLIGLRTVREMEALMLKLKKLDAAYGEGAADRALARIYHRAPAVISVGSKRKSRAHYEQALLIAPEHPGTLVFYADLLRAEDKLEEARATLDRAVAILMMQPATYENRYWLDHAGRVRGRLVDVK